MSTEQTPVKEDLTTESTTFDLDWAKCGGVWLLKGKGLQKDYFFVGYVEIENRIYMTNAANGDGESLLKKDLAHVRMATCAECEVAGLEYIEPPLKRVTELESAIRAFIDENKHLADGDNCTLLD